MSQEMPPDEALRLVGVERQQSRHVMRVDSSNGQAYILHSQDCLDMRKKMGQSLVECGYSKVLAALGLIDSLWTAEFWDVPVEVSLKGSVILPDHRLKPTHPDWRVCDSEEN